MPEKRWSEPCPGEWERIEQAVIDGQHPFDAARSEGFTLSALKRHDKQRHAELLELAWGEDRSFVRQKLRANTERAMQEHDYQGAVANRALELIGKHAGMFEDTTRVELTGGDGGPVQIEDRSARVDRVLEVLAAVGAASQLGSGTSERALPAARDILAPPSEG